IARSGRSADPPELAAEPRRRRVLKRDDFKLNHCFALASWLRMIFSEIRYPLFRIMRYRSQPVTISLDKFNVGCVERTRARDYNRRALLSLSSPIFAESRCRMTRESNYSHYAATKVPEVTLGFWIVKIAATTLGETGGDSVTMTLNWGYLTGTAIFLAALVILVALQIASKKFHPFLYWATIVASTTFGTTMADFADRSLGIGYTGGSTMLLALVVGTLVLWRWSEGSISVNTVITPKVEVFYWMAITFSQTLGTALGDWMADSTGLGYAGGAVVFGAALAALAILYFWTDVSRVLLFWAAFILTRPLGATVGDFPEKPVHDGGLALSRPIASVVIAALLLR